MYNFAWYLLRDFPEQPHPLPALFSPRKNIPFTAFLCFPFDRSFHLCVSPSISNDPFVDVARRRSNNEKLVNVDGLYRATWLTSATNLKLQQLMFESVDLHLNRKVMSICGIINSSSMSTYIVMGVSEWMWQCSSSVEVTSTSSWMMVVIYWDVLRQLRLDTQHEAVNWWSWNATIF